MAILPGDWPINAATTSGNDLADKLNRLASGTITSSGGVLTGPLVLNADPTTPLGAATKQYADARASSVQTGVDQAKADAASALANSVKKSGDTMSGALTVNAPLKTTSTLTIGNWTLIDEPGGLVIRLGGVGKLVLRGDGSLEALGNVTAYSTI